MNQIFSQQLDILEALKVTAIGLVVVFAVLAILILLIEFLHEILKENKKKAEKATLPEADAIEQDGEFLAAVSAAISAYINKPEGTFTIKSIKEKQ